MSRLTVNDPFTRGQQTSPETIMALSHFCFVAAFLSVVASLAIWGWVRTPEPGHAERLAIFVGLWAPTLFALSNRLEGYVLRNTSSQS